MTDLELQIVSTVSIAFLSGLFPSILAFLNFRREGLSAAVSQLEKDKTKLESEVDQLKNLHEAYYALELEYRHSVGELTGVKPKTVLEQYRQKVEDQGHTRPRAPRKN